MTVQVAAEPHLGGPDRSTWLARLDCERPRPYGALDWLLDRGHTEVALRMSSGLWRYWYNRPAPGAFLP